MGGAGGGHRGWRRRVVWWWGYYPFCNVGLVAKVSGAQGIEETIVGKSRVESLRA
jgi:hypothetical protein